MKLKGIKQGDKIELLQSLDIPDGTEVVVEIDPNELISEQQRQQKLKEFLQIPLENREELADILTELDKEQHLGDKIVS
ncbi:MAG TPA: hypothetical protein V6D15_03185 [Oculatellaceae cyanobacterium]|jgi:predicted DNA-binding antitoxin AbrB/MazE fold protein